MKRKISYFLLASALLFTPNINFGQTLNLGTIADFVLFTSAGDVSNTGSTTFTGDIGTDLGIISLGVFTQTGATYNANAVTAQAKIDLLSTYNQLQSLTVTNISHAPAFGGETITPGVYSQSGAGSIAGILTLDGLGDTNAVFILKFGGALAVGAASTVVLINGTRACNVFWIAEGAITMGASTTMKGSLISHAAAVSMEADGNLEGRMLSMNGAITFGTGAAYLSDCVTTIQLNPDTSCINIDLGTAVNFLLFTSNGAVSNTDVSMLTGDIGTNLGATTGFGTSTVIGSFYSADAITAQAKIDLLAAYNQLMTIPVTDATHAPAFGSGETLLEGVYSIGGAGSVAGGLTLDAQGDTNALFIFKFNGAFSTGAGTTVVLTNGTKPCRVFWVAEGAIGLAASTIMKGNLIANNDAVSMGADGDLEGRLFSTTGAVSVGPVIANTGVCFPCNNIILSIELLSFTSECNNQSILLKWSTASESNNDYFSIERSTDVINWWLVGKLNGAGTSSSLKYYSFKDNKPFNSHSYYRLKQTDFDGNFNYSTINSINNCIEDITEFVIYPNPTNGKVQIDLKLGDLPLINEIYLMDFMGRKVPITLIDFLSTGAIDLSKKEKGAYILYIEINGVPHTQKLFLQ